MDWWRIFLLAAASYLVGSLNISILVSKMFMRVDIRDYGSGNAGSTNAYRVMGKKWGAVVLAGDALKGVLVVLFGDMLMSGTLDGAVGRLVAGLFVVLGHVFPVYFKFRGGKGVMTTGAVLFVIDWRVFVVVLGIFVVSVLITRWISLGSILAAVFVPVFMYVLHRGQGQETIFYAALSAALALLVVAMHKENIMRILRGEERRFSFKGRAVLETIKTKTGNIKASTTKRIKRTSSRLRSKVSYKRKNMRRRRYLMRKCRGRNPKAYTRRAAKRRMRRSHA